MIFLKSLKKDFFLISTFLIILSAVAFGIFVTYALYRKELDNTKALIYQKNKALSFFVERYFKKFYLTLDFLSSLDIVINGSKLTEKEKEEVIDLYRRIQNLDPDINYIYSGYEDKTLLIYDYIPPEGFDPRVRPWYIEALKSAPNISGGIPYREIKTNEWLVSISKALYDEKGNLTGVIAIDTGLDKINELINKRDNPFSTMYSYIINNEQKIIFHPYQEYLLKQIKDLVGETFDLSSSEGTFEYKLNKDKKIAYYTNLDFLGWTVVTVVNKKEIISKILPNIIFSETVVIFISITLGLWISVVLYNKIISPLLKLRERIEKIIHGASINDNFKYPDNEIGIIASDVEKLTEKELYKKNLELIELNKKLEELSEKDKLTDLYNRRKMEKEMKEQYYLFKRYKIPFALLMMDIDDFKQINDTYGHMIGDKVLIKIAEILKNNIRASDIASRWGGEEFLIMAEDSNLKQAVDTAERIRKIIENEQFTKDIKVTVSIGVASIEDYPDISDIDELISAADKKLYDAKRKGKNRTEY